MSKALAGFFSHLDWRSRLFAASSPKAAEGGFWQEAGIQDGTGPQQGRSMHNEGDFA